MSSMKWQKLGRAWEHNLQGKTPRLNQRVVRPQKLDPLAEVERKARRLEASVIAGQCDPDAADQEIRISALAAVLDDK